MSELQKKDEEITLKPVKPSVFGMILNPSEQFERLKSNPMVSIPFLLVTLIYTIGTGIMAFGMESSWLLAELSPEEAELFAEIEMFMRIMVLVTGLFVPIIGALVFAVIFIIIAKMSSSAVTFKKLLSIGLFVSVIGGLGVVFNAMMSTIFGTNPDIPFTSLAILFSENNSLSNLLISIEVFAIWQLIVTVKGLRKVANFGPALAWLSTIVFYFIGILFVVFVS
ncbi:YIP1 family protein [Alkalihalobacterium sp. APHAB7]|uniref:YIP1 family protein n=1 Tax=Alkalihalobacterium sp. APHAB7 TaxID=3402081 RepID=UPI003AAA416E